MMRAEVGSLLLANISSSFQTDMSPELSASHFSAATPWKKVVHIGWAAHWRGEEIQLVVGAVLGVLEPQVNKRFADNFVTFFCFLFDEQAHTLLAVIQPPLWHHVHVILVSCTAVVTRRVRQLDKDVGRAHLKV
jgi:hypothetical protein